MIVEIGTSDFRTKAGEVDGLFIEPVKPYFDRLPECRKENVAISNRSGTVNVFYVLPEDIEMLGLPYWARGCNSIGNPHPTMLKLLANMFGRNGKNYIKEEEVKVERIKTVLDRHNITKIHELKIDTEGHDTVIVNDYLDTVGFLPDRIIFEANDLSSKMELNKTINKLKRRGYRTANYKNDIVATLK